MPPTFRTGRGECQKYKRRCRDNEVLCLALVNDLIEVGEQVSMVRVLHSEDKMVTVFLEEADVGTVGTDRVLGYNDLEMGMFRPEFGEESPAGIEFTVVFQRTVLARDDLGNQGDHFLAFRMDQGGS